MLPPHELKNKSFSKAMRGYNPVEVDEYISFLIERYTELYRENDELERKLKSTVARLDDLKEEEDSIRSTLIDAKHAANKIKADAEERAKSIVRTAKNSCNTILLDFNNKIEEGRATLAELHRDVFALKQELFERYSQHIQYIDALTEGMDENAIPDADALRRKAVDELKNNIAAMYATPEQTADNEHEVFEDTDKQTETSGGISLFTEDEDETDSTREFALSDVGTMINTSAEPLSIDREPLVSEQPKSGLRDSVLKANKLYKQNDTAVINTPDSDIDEANYDDFVRAVTGRSDIDNSKEQDFNMLFDDSFNPKKKK